MTEALKIWLTPLIKHFPEATMIHHKPFCAVHTALHFANDRECSCGATRKVQRGQGRVSHISMVRSLRETMRDQGLILERLAVEAMTAGSVDEDMVLGAVGRIDHALKEYRNQVIDSVAQCALPGI
jgi:hypothetical protein